MSSEGLAMTQDDVGKTTSPKAKEKRASPKKRLKGQHAVSYEGSARAGNRDHGQSTRTQ